jgi:hypothetical protein
MDKVLKAISQYRSKEIDFHDLRGWVVPCATELESKLGYDRRNFQNDIDNWFEYIEHAYKQEERHELTLSLIGFIESLIKDEPKPIVLPMDEKVVKEHLIKNGS